uniref:Uncharacterized protein n=1 Tax=Plectus sambesii TaxID=2011161 RepID=A0A914UTU0_9BILA
MAGSTSLYADAYCKVLKGELKIKCYFFPSAQAKAIRVDQIKGIYYDKPKLSKHCGTAKLWGMTFSPVWWACDMKRFFHGSKKYKIVVVNTGTSIKKGFTVKDMDAFLHAIRPMLPPDAIIINDLPF